MDGASGSSLHFITFCMATSDKSALSLLSLFMTEIHAMIVASQLEPRLWRGPCRTMIYTGPCGPCLQPFSAMQYYRT